MKLIQDNKYARFEYCVENTYEAGISLDGGEVKSVRAGNVSLKDAYCSVYNDELYIKDMHVAVYDRGGSFNVKDSRRDRKLLMHKSEIHRLMGKVNEKGYTIVPLKLYFKQSRIKMERGLCKGKNTYDKKQTIRERDLDRTAKREIKNYGI